MMSRGAIDNSGKGFRSKGGTMYVPTTWNSMISFRLWKVSGLLAAIYGYDIPNLESLAH